MWLNCFPFTRRSILGGSVKELELIIPKVPPSPNITLRLPYWKRTELNRMWRNLVIVELQTTHFDVPPLPFRKFTILIKQFRKRLLDWDNLYASCKPVIDALERNGIIVSDSPKHLLELKVLQEIKDKNDEPYIEILIQEAR